MSQSSKLDTQSNPDSRDSSDQSPLKWFPEHQRSEWFYDHYDGAARQIIDFFKGDDIDLEGRVIADIGCGDGITDLGVVHKARPRHLIGFDTRPTDGNLLVNLGREHNVLKELPPELEFRRSHRGSIPAEDHFFDFIYSWSTFEHVDDPAALCKEIHRVLRPDGVLMIQLYPFYYSQHGSHLWPWYPEGFAQFLHTDEELFRRVRSDPGPDPEWAEALLWDYKHLNRITLDDLHDALISAGFLVVKLELLTETLRLPPEVARRFPISQTSIAGVKLLAIP